MKLITFIFLFVFFSPQLSAQVVPCNCYRLGFWPFNKKSELSFFQEINFGHEDTEVIVYTPIISSDTLILKILPDKFLWKFKDQDNTFYSLTESTLLSDFNATFKIKMTKRTSLLMNEKIILELVPIFNYATTNAPMLYRIIIHSKKGISRLVFVNGDKKIFCFRSKLNVNWH
jgi:hypothetical protein